jgi:hypothetical protein
MTTTNQAKEIAYARFISVWDALSPPVPYVLDNESFQHPDSSEGKSWARFVVREVNAKQETLGPEGGRRFKRELVGTLELFCLTDKGTQKADQLVGAFRAAFEGVTVQDVYFLETQVVERGIEGNYHRVDALCKFWCSETK